MRPRFKMTDLRQFRYFVAVAEQASFSKAAAVLNISQPSLSVAVKALETEMGVALLKRGPKGAELTEAGRVFERRARSAIREADRAMEEVHQVTALRRGKVTLGLSSMLTAFIGPESLAAFHRSHPDIDLEVQVSTHRPEEVVRAIDGAHWDFGVMLLRPDRDLHSAVALEPLTRFDSGVYASASHPLVGKRRVSLADLSSYEWVTSSAALAAGFLFDVFRQRAVTPPRIATVTNSFNLIRELVGQHPYLCLLPHPFVRKEAEAGEIVKIRQNYISVTSNAGLVYPRDTAPTPAAADLMNVIRAAARKVS